MALDTVASNPAPPQAGMSAWRGRRAGVLPGIVGSIKQGNDQAHHAAATARRRGAVDALGMKFRELKMRKNPDCPVCGKNRRLRN